MAAAKKKTTKKTDEGEDVEQDEDLGGVIMASYNNGETQKTRYSGEYAYDRES